MSTRSCDVALAHGHFGCDKQRFASAESAHTTQDLKLQVEKPTANKGVCDRMSDDISCLPEAVCVGVGVGVGACNRISDDISCLVEVPNGQAFGEMAWTCHV